MPNDKDELEKLMAGFEEKLDQKKDKNILELSFEGSGGEFQFHRLNKKEAFRLKE